MSLLSLRFVLETCCCLRLRFIRLNPLEVINTDVTYSSFDLLYTQLGDLMGTFFCSMWKISHSQNFTDFCSTVKHGLGAQACIYLNCCYGIEILLKKFLFRYFYSLILLGMHF